MHRWAQKAGCRYPLNNFLHEMFLVANVKQYISIPIRLQCLNNQAKEFGISFILLKRVTQKVFHDIKF